MSRLEELIQQYCPDGVEYKTVRSISEIKRGERLTKSSLKTDGEYIVVSGGVSPMGRYTNYNRNENTITISSYGAAGYVGFQTEKFWANDVCLCVYPKDVISNKYLYYALKKEQNYLYSKTTKAIPDHIPTEIILDLNIPLPPLPVQEEIVRILDSFAELQAELQKRLQQYNYYRDNLFSFEGRTDVEWKKLGDVASIKTGRRFVRTDIRESGVPCFHYGDIYTYYGLTATTTKGYLDAELASKLRFAQPNDVVVVCAGENDMDIGVGVAWLGNEPAVAHDACCILHHHQNPRYISHFLRTHNYHLQIRRYVKNGKISSLPASGLAEAIIPIPSLEEQERIATILDRFDALTTDITAGLPAEIEARRKQYEYYRDKLLTFKQK